jgi:hypothetical protein
MPLRLFTPKKHAVRMLTIAALAIVFLLVIGSTKPGIAQNPPPPLTIFKNYFVTGDYVVGGWVEQSSSGGFATGTISIPDCKQAQAINQPCTMPPTPVIPAGADIVAAYLYWGTVEGSQSSFAGQTAFFNGYKIVGTILGNPNAPTSWSSGGCTGSSTGSKTMRFYRADVRPYLPLDLNVSPNVSPTFGALLGNPSVTVKIPDSGSTGNTQPNALGATLVLIYRVLSPSTPLNAIVLYDGSFAPSNGNPTMVQNLVGFYQPEMSGPVAKLTHIVANGQMNKGERVSLTSSLGTFGLSSLYTGTLGVNAPPFPGLYGAWDNPTWNIGQDLKSAVPGFDTSVTTSVSPTSTNSGCVNWGAMVLSTTVQDTDKDGLLDVWEDPNNPNQGYTDAVSGQHIALPGADPGTRDLFVEVDYLALRDAGGNILHTHLPKQAALDAVGLAFQHQTPRINVHFDLPAGIYSGDQFVIPTVGGGKEIPESSLICTDGAVLCAFPNQAAVGWKGGFDFVQNDPTLGNFQAGRAQSYRYALFGHATGEPKSYWGTLATTLATADAPDFSVTLPQLLSIVNSGTTATVKLMSPTLLAPGVSPLNSPLVLKPGDCTLAACGPNFDRISISGALAAPLAAGTNVQPNPPLNGTYRFWKTKSNPPDGKVTTSGPDANGMITTTFNITTSGVPDATYDFANEPQLGVSYLGPTGTSGHGDFSGGGDFAVTLGLWGADNAPGCQPDPTQTLSGNQVYCDDQVGTLKVQTGTLMHELGHTLTLTHGGTYYQQGSSVPNYEVNCKPNFISVMNYFFQVRGFVDGSVQGVPPANQFDYSGQTLPLLNETTSTNSGVSPLNESTGVGLESGLPSEHLTRWYSMPNAADNILQDQALTHCDGSPLSTSEDPSDPLKDHWVRVDGTLAPGGTFSAPLDWNNDLQVPPGAPAIKAPGEDLNHNGAIGDTPFSGFNDWAVIDLQQINARGSGFGFSEGGGLRPQGGGGLRPQGGGGVDSDGGGLRPQGGGGLRPQGGGGLRPQGGGGIEQDTTTANSTVDPPNGLSCTTPLTMTNGTVVPACTFSSGSFNEKGKAIPLTWTGPDFGQIRTYVVWRATGSFTTMPQIVANIAKFSPVGTLNNGNDTPPTPQFIDTFNLKSSTTYTYFVTDSNKPGAKSKASDPLVVILKF